MARRTKSITIEGGAENRDAGKTFLITEMPADQAERWATRALLQLAAAGVELPDGAIGSGLAGFAQASVQALDKLDYDKLAPLLAEMMDCVRYQPLAQGVAPLPLLEGAASQIEEVSTRITLRMAVLQIHVGFLPAAKS